MQYQTQTMGTQAGIQNSSWWVVLLIGILQVILGLFLIAEPGLTTLALIQFLGIYWVVLGVISIIQIFNKNRNVSWGWLLFTGILGILAGFLVLMHPYFGAVVTVGFLTFFIIITGIIRGAISLIQGIKGEGVWSTILGIALLLICLYLLFNPLGAFVALPIIIGIITLAGGIIMLIASYRVKGKAS